MCRRLFKGLTSLVIGSSLLLSSAPLSGFFTSVKSAGIAVTGVAYPQDAESAALNPAGISWVGSRLDIGLSPIRTDGGTSITGNAIPTVNGNHNAFQKHWIFNPHFGITKEFCNLPKPITLGLTLYNNADVVYCKYDQAFPNLGTSHLRLSYYQEVLAPTISIKLNSWNSVGFAVNFFAQRFKVVGLENFNNAFLTSNPGYVSTKGPQITNAVGVQVGWLSEPLPGVKLGFTYTPQTHIKRFSKYQGFLAGFGSLDSPERYAGGISVRLLPCLCWALDVTWEGWNRINTIHNPLVTRSGAPNNPQVGTDDGAGFGWRDRTYFRTGLDFAATENVNLRLGFRHARTPITQAQGAVNLLVLETVENIITCGFTYKINCDMEVSAFYAHGFNHEVKDCPIPPVLGSGLATIEQSKDAFGFSLGYYY